MELILASKSPRRKELMALLTPAFTVVLGDVDERAITAESPALLAQKLAAAKAAAVAVQYPQSDVIGSDTVVAVGEKVLGKPANQHEATEMLQLLSGRHHWVHTGICIYMAGEVASLFVDSTKVFFDTLTQEEIKAYTNTPEPYDKAGGYGIQGAMARHIPRIEGCYHSVMGLPVSALYQEMKRLGLLE